MYQRPHFQELISRLAEPRNFIQVIAGPRQVGKTTLVGQLLETVNMPVHFASADGVVNGDSVWLEQQWEIARFRMKQSESANGILAIDEIQKIPNWSEIVKANWDADTRQKTGLKVILLGSSRLLLQQGLTESLMGRFELTYLGHWSFSEMNAAFGMTAEQFVWFGGYPGPVFLTSDEPRWKQYISDSLIEPSISRDILSLTRVDKPALLRRLFDLGCLYSGQIISYTKIVGQLHDAGNTTTLAHYLELLDSAGLLGGLEKFSGNHLRQRASSPKFQVHNTALISARHPEQFKNVLEQPDQWGRLVESAVGAHLLNYARQEHYKLFYWREGNDEIDFVLEHHGKTVALEIKSSFARSYSGMEKFRQKFQPDKMLLIGKTGLPWQELLQINPRELF
ncbi:MAG: ATP-binding protein [Bacteroidia bacterium]|nr:ATP-binding protein [Bacteroidia bacterium]